MANRTKVTVEKRREFVEWLACGWTITAAARQVGLSRTAIHEHRQADPLFDAEVERALAEGGEMLEQEAFRRATQGTTREKGVYHRGQQVGAELITEYSDTLLIFLLKGRFPEKYRERVSHDVQIDLSVRNAAAKLALELGLDADELIADAERILREAAP